MLIVGHVAVLEFFLLSKKMLLFYFIQIDFYSFTGKSLKKLLQVIAKTLSLSYIFPLFHSKAARMSVIVLNRAHFSPHASCLSANISLLVGAVSQSVRNIHVACITICIERKLVRR